MDGIFGVGPAEMLIIVFVLLVIGGPQNTVKWARELGKMIRQLRLMWSKMMRELEKELGEEGREVMKSAQELSRNVNQLRQTTNPRHLASQATRFVENLAPELEKSSPTTKENTLPDETTKYAAWQPKEKTEG